MTVHPHLPLATNRDKLAAMAMGYKIRHHAWAPNEYIHMNEKGTILDEHNDRVPGLFSEAGKWERHVEIKGVMKFKYAYEYNGAVRITDDFFQTDEQFLSTVNDVVKFVKLNFTGKEF